MNIIRIVARGAILVGFFLPTLGEAQQSRIELHTHFSSILSIQKNFNIFLPEGYDQESDRYPVVYLFRGHESEWANASQDGSRRGNIKTVADSLYNRGAIGKMILIMPGLTGLPPVPAAEFSYVLDELIPYVDAHFRTRPVREQRGIDGFSMGGYDALHLLWRSPETFITFGTYDGSFWAFEFGDQLANASDSYWARVYPMKFMIHSAFYTDPPIQQFVDLLDAHGIQNAFDPLPLSPSALHNWYFADLHMESTLPLHWKQFSHGSGNLAVSLLSPLPGTKISGEVPVSWSLETRPDSLQTFLKYSRDRGNSWHSLYVSNTADTTFLWNTATVPDGTQYLLMVQVVGDTVYGFIESAGRFTVDNPGNGAPEVKLLSTTATEQPGFFGVLWWAEDADGDQLLISLDASPDGGTTWEHISDEPNTGAYLWDTRRHANSSSYRVRIRSSDGQASSEDLSPTFAVHNLRPTLKDTLIRHIAGAADGKITVNALDPGQVTGHTYRVFFHDSIPGSKVYSVLDVDRSTTVVPPTLVPSSDREGPLFDGLRLVFDDYDPPRISRDSTRWIIGTSDLVPQVMLPQFDPGTGLITGTPYASDYYITLYDHVVDTSAALFGLPASPIHFTVWNATENHKVNVLFAEFDNNQTISRLDDLILLEEDSSKQSLVTWELFFSGPENVTSPSPGDIFLLKILKPFTGKDVYELVALPSGIVSVATLKSPDEFRLEQNFPNPFNPVTTFQYTIPVGTYGHTSLRVYDVLGREVATLVDGVQEAGAHTVRFDATNLASGVYFYRITVGDLIKTRKMMLMK